MPVQAQIKPGIYTCTDAKGRRLTSDRPIPECLDREQRELSQSGTTKRVVGASLTAEERAKEEAKQQQEAALKAKAYEERRKDRALISRYPNQRLHDEERAKQLSRCDLEMSRVLELFKRNVLSNEITTTAVGSKAP